jgi:hypothetical protein
MSKPIGHDWLNGSRWAKVIEGIDYPSIAKLVKIG